MDHPYQVIISIILLDDAKADAYLKIFFTKIFSMETGLLIEALLDHH